MGHSCTTQLLSVIEELTKSMDDRKRVDMYCCFWILPKLLHHALLINICLNLKLQSYGIIGKSLQQISQWLTKRSQSSNQWK